MLRGNLRGASRGGVIAIHSSISEQSAAVSRGFFRRDANERAFVEKREREKESGANGEKARCREFSLLRETDAFVARGS